MKKYIIVSILTLLTAPFISFASIDYNLKYGQKSTEVSELQDFLIDKGLLQSNSTGFFGLMTLKAVKIYQTSVSVPSTGYVGALTRAKINSEITSALSSSIEAEIAETGTTTPTGNSQVVTKYATTTIIQYIYQNTPTPNQPVVNTPPPTSSEPVVSQACKDETANLKEKEYNVSSQIKERDRQIQNVDIFETGSSPDARERRKQEIRNDFSYEITKSQDTVSKYQDKVKAVCN